MTAYLKAGHILIFDYPRFAQPLRDALRQNAERLAAQHRLEILFIRKRNFRREERNPCEARESPWPGVHLLGPGTLCQLPALARQENWQDLLAATVGAGRPPELA
jgi:hypothetical protein